MSRSNDAGAIPRVKAAHSGLRAELPAQPGSVGQARSAVRRALATWGMPELSGDAELLASELVANAVEHADGTPISFSLRCQADAGGHTAVVCEVSDSSPALPRARRSGPDAERGRGLAIVDALATASGVQIGPAGKTAWFRLAVGQHAQRIACSARVAAEPEPAA
jgi:anti-sigma regulatory factor (Ser/Thr protein kinase)